MTRASAMTTWSLALLLSATAAASGIDDGLSPGSLPDRDPVQVEWTDPDGFSEIRYSRNRFEARRGNWVQHLAEHLQQQAAGVIGPGERLQLLITDIDLAGQYEPVGVDMRDVRVVRDVYPPRMQIEFVRYAADGRVMQQGRSELSDLGFLSAAPRSTHDALRFEKHMIDAWVRREFGTAAEPRR